MLTLTLPVLTIMAMNMTMKLKLNKMMWWESSSLLIILSFMSLLMLPSSTNIMSSMSTMDMMSNMMITLSIMMAALMMMTSTKILHNSLNPLYFIMLNTSLMFILIVCFSTSSIFTFYIAFEASLIPTMLIIMMWGYQPERMQASMYMMMYTVMASVPMFIMFYYLYSTTKNTNLFINTQTMFNTNWPMFMCIILIMGFLVKLPMFTTHLWLPKAHVEAPIAGSMVLAAILLKLGGYGIARLMNLIPHSLSKLSTPLIAISLTGAVVTSLICIRQTDLKSMIAYSSVGHMGLMLSGVMTNSLWGMYGMLLIMIAHAMTSSALFALANLSYEITHTRSLFLMKGMYMLSPIMSMWWFMFCAINMAAPPSINLLSEIMLMTSIMSMSMFFMIPLMLVTFLTGTYSLIMYSTTQHGFSQTHNNPNPIMMQKNYSMLIIHLIPLISLIMKPASITMWI